MNNCRILSVSDGFDSNHRVVVMDCSFPSRHHGRRIFHPLKHVSSPNKSLRSDEYVVKSYSNALEISLNNFDNLTNVDDLSDKITKSV